MLTMNDQKKSEPKLLNVMVLYLPTKNPYTTAKWYQNIFDLNADEINPPDPNKDLAVLNLLDAGALFFVKSNDNPSLDFYNIEGHNHAIILFTVKNIEEVYKRMVEKGVKIKSNGITDRGGCGNQIAFYDPDGRLVEINDYGTNW
jgi:predicted enzyme related to lactoylglutathione lyase